MPSRQSLLHVSPSIYIYIKKKITVHGVRISSNWKRTTCKDMMENIWPIAIFMIMWNQLLKYCKKSSKSKKINQKWNMDIINGYHSFTMCRMKLKQINYIKKIMLYVSNNSWPNLHNSHSMSMLVLFEFQNPFLNGFILVFHR